MPQAVVPLLFRVFIGDPIYQRDTMTTWFVTGIIAQQYEEVF